MPGPEKGINLNSDSLPDFKKNIGKITEQLRMLIVPPDTKEVFDSIAVTWRDYGKVTEERVRIFEDALALPNIPRLEVSDAAEYLKNTKEDWDKFAEGVSGIANGVKFKWSEMRELSTLAEKVRDINENEDFQAIALLHAISETHREGRTPQWIRQRIAQQAFDEIVDTGAYRALDYSGSDDWVEDRTTQDDFNEEKSELVGALSRGLWDKKTLAKRTRDYKKLRMIILEGDNYVDEEAADSLGSLWRAANGEAVTRNSALHFLQLTEDIYDDLEEGEAFDVELLEEEDDE